MLHSYALYSLSTYSNACLFLFQNVKREHILVLFWKARNNREKLPLLSVSEQTYNLLLNVFDGWNQGKLIGEDEKKPSEILKMLTLEITINDLN